MVTGNYCKLYATFLAGFWHLISAAIPKLLLPTQNQHLNFFFFLIWAIFPVYLDNFHADPRLVSSRNPIIQIMKETLNGIMSRTDTNSHVHAKN